MNKLGFKTSLEAWDHRLQDGQRGTEMSGLMTRFGRARAQDVCRLDRSDRQAARCRRRRHGRRGSSATSSSRCGTGAPTSYIHDEVTTAKANPS